MKEIIVDNFAGGGGASTGIELATGRSVDIAINHDPNAIAMHTTNHPDTLHYCESVFDIDPIAATAGRPVGLAWFSPDCRHFSKAKGSKPVKKEIRGLAWVVVRWALAKKPRVVMLENVEEFKTWGPLITAEDGTEHPDPARAGETFAAFVAMLTTGIDAEHPALQECCEVLGIDINSIDANRLQSGLGYIVDHKELRASDYGAPTIRKRFFMVMRCDGLPVMWPEPTHGDPKLLEVQSGHRKPWRTAAECIDWSIPCPSIFERKKPLAENTLKRIARGIQRFVIDNPMPFIVKCNHTSSKTSYDCFRGQALDQPLQTITKTHGYAVVTPHITKFRSGATGQECDEPLPTITAGSSARPGGNGHALGMVEAKLAPFIARIGQTGFGGDRMAYEAEKPLTTITSKAEHLLVAPIIAREFGNSVGHVVDEPSGTITASGGGKSRLVSAFLAKHFGGNYTGSGADLNQPAHTVTMVDHHALVTSNLIKLRGTCKDGQQVTQPMPTITAGGLHIGEVRAFLLKYYGNEKEGVSLNDPLHTVTTNDRFGLVTVEGIDYQIVDIGMRMLQPHELYAAQGFPSWYIIDRDYTGTKYAKDKQVARCGNAVPPPFAEALVRANLPEMCIERKEVAA
ncbi:DNA cytosine methyltransferase [Yersinia enterocolitica]|uniref:DNA cytosine methyltransferase n=1 Tax=Yersinia enterocolitica TaxID=630 RepID=UPI0005DB7041|nr:DNA cytosine methyltransferase [Yersinia enterocolitica]ELI8290878.1 DNA cytosine methyltransferase [Yersinia enterocolitica]CQH51160.1 putative cytosine-specific modification methylase [Yersinia enterocolitica]HDL7727548.1 DNA cytosine methyltransferase [Yersinia enterocolitica]HDM8297642.1 DNA cytosine methyltransferase [Yersinia enterocolitica]HDM8326515.1 DNA cytosine methyltransferase [Yersinia enterocolitica]